MGATTAHRAPERVVDGTCTRVWAWMTNKCRKRINGRDHPKQGGSMVTRLKIKGINALGSRGKRKKRAQRKETRSWDARGVGSSRPWARGPFSLGLRPSDSMYFSPPKQVVASSEPNFWTHSLQIHCNGLGPKTVTLQLAPSVGKLFVR